MHSRGFCVGVRRLRRVPLKLRSRSRCLDGSTNALKHPAAWSQTPPTRIVCPGQPKLDSKTRRCDGRFFSG